MPFCNAAATASNMNSYDSSFLDLPTPKLKTPRIQVNNIFFPDDMVLDDMLTTATTSTKQPETLPSAKVWLVTPSFIDAAIPSCDLLKTPDLCSLGVSMDLPHPSLGSELELLASTSSDLSLELASPRLEHQQAVPRRDFGISRSLYDSPTRSTQPVAPPGLNDLDPSTLESAIQDLTSDGFFGSASAEAASTVSDSSSLSFHFLDDMFSNVTPMQDGGSTSNTCESNSSTCNNSPAEEAPAPVCKRAKRVTRTSVSQDWSTARQQADSSSDEEEYETPVRRHRKGKRKSNKSNKEGVSGTRRVENMSENKRKHIRKLARAAAKRRKDKEEALWQERATHIAGLDDRRAQLQADIDETQTQILALLQTAKAQLA